MATDVALVNMPFGAVFRPSLGLSQIAAVLRQAGFTVRTFDFTIRLAERIGHEAYVDFSNQRPLPTDQVGEWIFAGDLFSAADGDDGNAAENGDRERRRVDAFVAEILERRHPFYATPVGQGESRVASPTFIANVRALRALAPAFLEQCAGEVLAAAPRVIGFGSVFQQQTASLALARRLKRARPDLVVLLGGANCEGPMGAETARSFTFVDAVVSGEGEGVAVDLVRRALAGEPLVDPARRPPGVFLGGEDHLAGQGPRPRLPNAPSPPDLDALPLPDPTDYLANLRASQLDPSIRPLLLYETSRGCWWGQKSHCSFCGLNAQGMAYRSKSPERVLADLQALAHAHPGASVSIVDNILDMRYFRDLVPRLAELSLGLDLFYEVKANLRKDQLRALAAAGIRSIQPGVESFSTPILGLMGKGVRGIQNVQLLKWCRELGVVPYWNLLWGFPGEDPAEYAATAGLLPALVHLPPPMSCGRIRLDRFSPNYERSGERGFDDVRPYPAYHHVYGELGGERLANLAYYFAFDYAVPRDVPAYTAATSAAAEAWKRDHPDADLFYVDDGATCAVWDFRPAAREPLLLLDGLERAVLLAADGIIGLDRLGALADNGDGGEAGVSRPAVTLAVDALVERRLLLREGDLVLALPLPIGPYQPRPAVRERWRRLAHELAPAVAVALATPVAA